MELGDLFPAVITFVAIGVLLAFGLSIQGTIQKTSAFGYVAIGAGGCNSSSEANCGYEYNASRSAIQANDNMSKNLPIMGTIIVAAVVIGVLVKAFVLK
jgi:hypothetical protein